MCNTFTPNFSLAILSLYGNSAYRIHNIYMFIVKIKVNKKKNNIKYIYINTYGINSN